MVGKAGALSSLRMPIGQFLIQINQRVRSETPEFICFLDKLYLPAVGAVMELASTFVSLCPVLLALHLRQKLSSLSHGASAGVVPTGLLVASHRTPSGLTEQRAGGCKVAPGCAAGLGCLAERPTC
jgi:hypothetical protein